MHLRTARARITLIVAATAVYCLCSNYRSLLRLPDRYSDEAFVDSRYKLAGPKSEVEAMTRVYDIRGLLIYYVPDSEGPGGGLLAPTRWPSIQQSVDDYLTPEWDRGLAVDAVIAEIQRMVEPNTWKDNEGAIGSIRELGGQLIITQSVANQSKVASRLRWMTFRHRWSSWLLHTAKIVIPIGVLMALIEWIVWRLRRSSIAKAGLCSNCNYDLRASRERCPECGMPIPTSASRNALPV